jgi:hypothetical protein
MWTLRASACWLLAIPGQFTQFSPVGVTSRTAGSLTVPAMNLRANDAGFDPRQRGRAVVRSSMGFFEP